MKVSFVCVSIVLVGLSLSGVLEAADDRPWPRFEVQEIDRSLTVGYAVLLHDLNGDRRPDIVVVDSRRLIWFENPSWKLHTILPEGVTRPDNVCISPADVDRDAHVDLILGAGWRGFNTRDPGTLQWVRHPGRAWLKWEVRPIDQVISLHRIRTGDIDHDGEVELVVAPLLGPGTTRDGNFMQRPVPLFYYDLPPGGKGTWQRRVIDDRTLHVMHNIWLDDLDGNGKLEVVTASYEGVRSYEFDGETWSFKQIGEGDQSDPQHERGASEVKTGKLADGRRIVATIEPWHGDKAVVYVQQSDPRSDYRRIVLDDRLKQGHGVWCSDLDGDGNDEVIVGFRQHYSAQEQYGLRIYRVGRNDFSDRERLVLDNGGMACEDLGVADLDGDGREDIVAVGRATHNVKIYWNRSPSNGR